MNTKTIIAIVAIIATIGGIAAMPFYTAPVDAAANCHSNQGRQGCNPQFFFGGFVCNKGSGCLTYLIMTNYE